MASITMANGNSEIFNSGHRTLGQARLSIVAISFD